MYSVKSPSSPAKVSKTSSSSSMDSIPSSKDGKGVDVFASEHSGVGLLLDAPLVFRLFFVQEWIR